jgi:hypothetical protein
MTDDTVAFLAVCEHIQDRTEAKKPLVIVYVPNGAYLVTDTCFALLAGVPHGAGRASCVARCYVEFGAKISIPVTGDGFTFLVGGCRTNLL